VERSIGDRGKEYMRAAPPMVTLVPCSLIIDNLGPIDPILPYGRPGIIPSGKGAGVPRSSLYRIALTDDERSYLEAAARRYASQYRDVVRTRIVLYAADGLDNDARFLGNSVNGHPLG
jgi:hypothetical protein